MILGRRKINMVLFHNISSNRWEYERMDTKEVDLKLLKKEMKNEKCICIW